MELISFSEAKKQGLTTYFTGKPCKRGHIAERHVNGGCKECDRLKKKQWRAKNPEESRRRVKKYQADNKAAYSKHKLAAHKNRRETDMEFNIRLRLRRRLNGALKRVGAIATAPTLELIGCTQTELIQHLEQQFSEGMSWDNYGEWHVDHIRPCASFDLTDSAQQRKCFHFSNLQPLWAADNHSKGARWDEGEVAA